MAFPLYRPHELSFRTQYAEVKERSRAASRLLPGTPGRLVLRTGTGYGLPVPRLLLGSRPGGRGLRRQGGRQRGVAGREGTYRIRRLDSAPGARPTKARVPGRRQGGRSCPGRAAQRRPLRERPGARRYALLHGMAQRARRQDRRRTHPGHRSRASTGAEARHPLPFLGTIEATKLKFSPVPGMPSRSPATSVKRPARTRCASTSWPMGPRWDGP